MDLCCAYDMPLDEFSQNLFNQRASELKLPSIYCELSYGIKQGEVQRKFKSIRSTIKPE